MSTSDRQSRRDADERYDRNSLRILGALYAIALVVALVTWWVS